MNPNPNNLPWCYHSSSPFFASCGVGDGNKVDCAPGLFFVLFCFVFVFCFLFFFVCFFLFFLFVFVWIDLIIW